MTPSLLRRCAAAIALLAGALVLAPAAHAHSLGYSDPSEPGLHPGRSLPFDSGEPG